MFVLVICFVDLVFSARIYFGIWSSEQFENNALECVRDFSKTLYLIPWSAKLSSGGYDKEERAAKAYDLAALKYWGPTTHINFPVSNIGFSFNHVSLLLFPQK